MRSESTFKSIVPGLLLPLAAICGSFGTMAQDAEGPKLLEADPASGTKVESLSEIILTMDQPTVDAVTDWGLESVPLPAPFGASSDVTATLWYPQGDLTKLKITIEPTLTQDGTYEVTVPAGYIGNSNEEYNSEFKLVYTIGSGTSGEDPVQYDLNYSTIDPEPGTYEALNTVTLTFDTEVFTDPEARAYLYQNDMVYKGVQLAVRDGNKVDLLFENFDTEGVYELVIERGMIGDAKWSESHHLGHANPEIRLKSYRIEESKSKVTQDFIPALTPDGNVAVAKIDRITLSFSGAWCATSEETPVLYGPQDEEYPLTVSMGETLSEAVLTPDAPINSLGQYRLVIPAGVFGNSDYEESNGEEGAVNPEIKVTYDVNPEVGVQAIADGLEIVANAEGIRINGNGAADVWSIDGKHIARVVSNGSAEVSLAAGLYIVRANGLSYKINIR